MPFHQPRYKRLAHNDTGSAVGHQAGVLIPKAIASYFPALPSGGSSSNPTVDVALDADLFVGGTGVGHVQTRFQHQTWGGTRRAERRITGNLGDLLGSAAQDDLLIFERDTANALHYRLTLHKVGTPSYKALQSKIGVGRWGRVAS